MAQDDDKLRADIIAQLEAIAFAQPSAFLKVDAQGQLRSDLKDCTPEQLEPLKEFQVVIRQTPGRGSSREIQVGFKMHDKMRALDKLYKHLLMDEASKSGKKRNGL
jgi:hypothetical protein